MKQSFLTTALFALAASCAVTGRATDTSDQPHKDSSPRVIVDPRVELMSIIFRLAGNPEYCQGRVPQYSKDVDKHFGPHKSHPVVQLAGKLRRTHGVSYDAVMGMAVHVVDGFTLAEKVPFSPLPVTLDKRWKPSEAREFLAKARQFAEDSSFKTFFEAHQPLYDTAVSRMQKVIAEHGHLDWFDEFFGHRPGASFTVQLGMLNGGGCYGVRSSNSKGNVDLFCVLGVWKTDWLGSPVFDASMLPTVIHEFCHSYTNPVVDRHLARLEPAGRRIFPHVDATMRRQAYATWQTMMYESFVRACVVRYVLRYQGKEAAAAETKQQTQRGFAWVGDLSELLAEYESNRNRYRDLDSFVPQIAAFFNRYAESFADSQAQTDVKSPRIVSTTPANGAKDVDPRLTKITVVFDRLMQDGSWSLVGSGPNFPKIVGKPSYDKKCMTWTVGVQLRPNWEYRFMLNSERFLSFRSRDGVALEPVQVSFRTGGRK